MFSGFKLIIIPFVSIFSVLLENVALAERLIEVIKKDRWIEVINKSNKPIYFFASAALWDCYKSILILPGQSDTYKPSERCATYTLNVRVRLHVSSRLPIDFKSCGSFNSNEKGFVVVNSFQESKDGVWSIDCRSQKIPISQNIPP